VINSNVSLVVLKRFSIYGMELPLSVLAVSVEEYEKDSHDTLGKLETWALFGLLQYYRWWV